MFIFMLLLLLLLLRNKTININLVKKDLGKKMMYENGIIGLDERFRFDQSGFS